MNVGKTYNGVGYWGSARGPGVTFYYEKCGNCGGNDKPHKCKGLCQKCYLNARLSGDLPYAPLGHYVAEKQNMHTRESRKEAGERKKARRVKIYVMFDEDLKSTEIAEKMNMTPRMVFYYKKDYKKLKNSFRPNDLNV